MEQLTYPADLFEIYREAEEREILAICREVAQLNTDPIEDENIIAHG